MNNNAIFKKTLLIIVISILIIFLGLIFVAPHYINTNLIKNKLTQYSKVILGKELIINGDIKLAIFPKLDLSVKDLVLKNNPDYESENFIKAEQIDISASIISLLSGQLVIDDIILIKPEVIIEEKNGHYNYELTTSKEQALKHLEDDKISEEKNITYNFSKRVFNTLKITDGKIIFKNSNQHFEISNLDLNLDSLSYFKYILQTSLTLANNNELMINLDIDNVINIDEKKVKFDEINLNLNKISQNNIDLLSKNTKLSGDLELDFTNDILVINNNFDIDQLIITINKKSINENTNQDSLSKKSDSGLDFSFLKTFNLKSKLNLAYLKYNNYEFSDIQFITNNQNAKANMNIKINDFFSGKFQQNIRLGVDSKIKLDGDINNLSMKDFSEKFNFAKKMSGSGKFQWQLETLAKNDILFKRNLNGFIEGNIADGVIFGIDLNQIVDLHNNKDFLQFLLQNSRNKTYFSKALIDLKALNGIFKTNNSLLESDYIVIKANGSIHLPLNQLDFHFTPWIKNKKGNLKESPLSIIVSGDISNPNYMLDISKLVEEGVKKGIEILNNGINKSLEQEDVKDLIDGLKDNGKDIDNLIKSIF